MARPACRWLHDARHIAQHRCSPSLPFVLPPFLLRCLGVAFFVLASGLCGFWRVCGVVGLGGGLPDAGSGPLPWSFPFGGLMLALPVRV